MRKKLLMAIMLALFVAIVIPKEAYAMSEEDYNTYASVFDANYYYAANPDVAVLCGMDYRALLNHFLTVGMYEGRSASYDFNPSVYINKNPDLQKVFGTNIVLYFKHYALVGCKENRIANINPVQADTTGLDIKFVPPTVLATRTTTYNAKIGRAKNVELAAAAINGTMIMPGGSFSYNEVVGPRTAARGYVEATVYNSGEVTTGIGGGICQVSSTLYAAMKDCGLPATERHAHSLPVHYLPTGYDATVAYGSLDLKFNNIYTRPLLITTNTDNGNLTVSLTLY